MLTSLATLLPPSYRIPDPLPCYICYKYAYVRQACLTIRVQLNQLIDYCCHKLLNLIQTLDRARQAHIHKHTYVYIRTYIGRAIARK